MSVQERFEIELNEITSKFYDSFSTNGLPRVDQIHELFIEEGIVVKNSGNLPEIYTLVEFVEPRKKLIEEKILTNFIEFEVKHRTLVKGKIAQRISYYRKKGVLSGKFFEGKGVKMFHFILTLEGWKISSLIWDDERNGFTLNEMNI